MENLLKQMYADMNATQTIPLEQLAVANPDLYAQMRTAAESTVHAYDRERGDRGGGGGGGTGAGRGGESSGWRADAAPVGDDTAERKMSLRSATGLGVKLIGKGGVTEGKRGSGPFVNAFIAEAPVVVDISRAEALLKQLLDTEIKTASLADAESIFTGEKNLTTTISLLCSVLISYHYIPSCTISSFILVIYSCVTLHMLSLYICPYSTAQSLLCTVSCISFASFIPTLPRAKYRAIFTLILKFQFVCVLLISHTDR
jgi:hypothetical protein